MMNDRKGGLWRAAFSLIGQRHYSAACAARSRARRHAAAASFEINTRAPTLNVAGISPIGFNL
jgi:hypothetical protein